MGHAGAHGAQGAGGHTGPHLGGHGAQGPQLGGQRGPQGPHGSPQQSPHLPQLANKLAPNRAKTNIFDKYFIGNSFFLSILPKLIKQGTV